MSNEPLLAHSLAEAYLYLMATSCGCCGRGLLHGGDARRIESPQDRPRVTIEATCHACHDETTHNFQLAREPEADKPNEGAVVNPTGEPSRIIDVGQWIVLFRIITEAAGRETDKVQARHLGIEAAQCLEEALKFYDEVGNDLPPPEALFHEVSRKRFQKSPEHFSRQRLINLRAKLPTLAVMRSRLKSPAKRPWWRPWK